MSLDGRLRQGLTALADPIDVDYELGLVRVQAVARQRERRHVIIAAFAGAAAGIALLLSGGKLADLVLGLENPLPPAEERSADEEIDRDDIDLDRSQIDDGKIVRDDTRIDDALDQADDVEPDEGGAIGPAGRSNPRIASSSGSDDLRGDGLQGRQHEEPQRNPLPRTERADDANYTVANSGVATSGQATCNNGQEGACFEFEAQDDERYVTVDIRDASGAPVYAWVQQNTDGDPQSDGGWTSFCGSTSHPIPIEPGAVVRVMLDAGSCGGTDSNPTSGTIFVTFTNRL